MRALLEKNIRLQPEENILIVVRKHWFILLFNSIGILMAGLIPFILALIIAPMVSIHPALPAYITSVWMLMILMMLFTVWTNYYLDIWIVTDKRIINIDQIHLFKRDILTLRIERVQDVRVQVHGIFATLMRFGNLEIQTAGAESMSSIIKGIPNPRDVRNVILEYVDMVTEHKNKYAYNKEQRPSESE